MKGPFRSLILIISIIVGGIIIFWSASQRRLTNSLTTSIPPISLQTDSLNEKASNQLKSSQVLLAVKNESKDITGKTTAELTGANPEVEIDTGEESENYEAELQPREFFVMDFTTMKSLPASYKMENLELTPEGIQLLPPAPGEENIPRYGVLESGAEPLQFPSNAVTPLWLEKIPEGAEIFVEVSMSPDGINWGMWHPIMPDMDSLGQMSEYYPDGSLNPNYGYTPGGVLCWGFRQYLYFRYRITLYSEVPESPKLLAFRLFYQDTTMGQGHLAEVNQK
ncbi:MAG: hypothetical protein N2246_04360 [Candidatus Sumerlaeia bacterium]|nr:hypothetical protein [Candidatus Sumerlaeia bacterium]